jgi:hypothetical protein
MNFEAMSSIQQVVGRINEIQGRFSPANAPAVNVGKDTLSFEKILEQTMQGKLPNGLNSMLPGGLPLFNFMPQGVGAASWVLNAAAQNPDQVITYNGHNMQAQTAAKFSKLEAALGQAFPGRAVTITSTMDGKHSDPNHAAGKALDFVVDGLTKEESRTVENLCKESGFKPYNEYLYSSTYKTGDHMHIDLI